VDIGGTHVKILATGEEEPRKFPSGLTLTAKWRRHVEDVVTRLMAALEPDEVVLGGGNVKILKELPPGCRAGDNANAFLGGFRLWEQPGDRKPSSPAKAPLR
jgi:hypothetical protein